MRFGRITDQHAAQVVACLVDDDVCAVQEEEAMAVERAEVDRLLEEVDVCMRRQRRAEWARLSLDRRDAHPYRRTRRRNERRRLRALPSRLPVSGESDAGEAA